MKGYGFSRELLVSMSGVDEIQDGRLYSRLEGAIKHIEGMCRAEVAQSEDDTAESLASEGDDFLFEPEDSRIIFEPEYVANALLRPRKDILNKLEVDYREVETLLQYIIISETIDDNALSIELFEAYHPDNRMIMPFQIGVREDGTIVDVPPGVTASTSIYVDERGKLIELS